jgi:hypothetical protein
VRGREKDLDQSRDFEGKLNKFGITDPLFNDSDRVWDVPASRKPANEILRRPSRALFAFFVIC